MSQKIYCYLSFIIVFIMIGHFATAQTRVIRAVVSGASSKQPILGASVTIEGTTQGVITDKNGAFEISMIEPGRYGLLLSSLNYQQLTVSDIVVEADKVLQLNLEMIESEAGETMKEVVVSAARLRNSSSAVISEIKSAAQVASGISAQQITLSQDKDAAQVMSRIPGITIVDNRFVMVRGISERYNQVMLNNAIAPSTEVDRRTFAFDLIPSGVLERLMVYKSGSPENPGDFAGGLIKVYTNSASTQNFTSFSVGTGFRTNTTFKPYIYSRKSSTDFLGFDNGERGLPKGFPTENFRNLPNNNPLLTEAPKMLNNDLSYSEQNAIPDYNFGVSLGRYWSLGNKRLNMLTSVNYGQSYQSYQRDFSTYLIQSQANYGKPAEPRTIFLDNRYEKDNRVGVLSNWALIFNPFSKIEFKNLFNQIGENTTILRDGEDFVQHAGLKRKNYMYQYRSRSIYAGQLEGTHRFKAGISSINWIVGGNYLGEKQPDLRRFRTIQTASNSSQYRMIFPPSSNLYETGRYFGKLNEYSLNNGLNYEYRISGSAENPTLLKVGYLIDYRNRTFDSRYFSYRVSSNVTPDQLAALEVLPLNQIFADANFGNNGFTIEEGTSPRDSYTANNLLSAGYAGIVWPINSFNISAGVRLEYNIQRLNSASDLGDPINIDNRILSPLGFLNVDYSFNDKNKIRFGYGRTVNRPEFREIAPFLYYDYEYDANRYGEPGLKTAYIDNLDLRYELYPRSGETVSLGAFFKRFTDPIETRIIPQGETASFGYTNAEGGAFNYGLEFEFRKSFRGLTSSGFVDKISANINASYIVSEVDYKEETGLQDVKRPLQGQSPYIINGVLNYQDNSWQVSAAYNILGPRIFAIGNLMFPAIYELPRNAVDLTITKSFANNFSLKVGVQNLLNASYRFYQDTDRNRKIDINRDDAISDFKKGSLYNATLTYTIK